MIFSLVDINSILDKKLDEPDLLIGVWEIVQVIVDIAE